MESTTNAAPSIGLLCTWITGCSKPAKCRELCGPRSCCLCGLVGNVVRMHSSGCTASSKHSHCLLCASACRCLWWRWLQSSSCCCSSARRLCELHLTDGSSDLLHHLQRRAGLELKNGTRYSFVSHSKKSLWLLRFGIKAIAEKFVRSNRELKQTQRNEIKRRGGRQK